MAETRDFYYEPDSAEPLSTEVVTAVAKAHDEDVLKQRWRISDDINADSLNGLFQEHNLDITLQFEADSTTITITADEDGDPMIRVESHR